MRVAVYNSAIPHVILNTVKGAVQLAFRLRAASHSAFFVLAFFMLAPAMFVWLWREGYRRLLSPLSG